MLISVSEYLVKAEEQSHRASGAQCLLSLPLIENLLYASKIYIYEHKFLIRTCLRKLNILGKIR